LDGNREESEEIKNQVEGNYDQTCTGYLFDPDF
jgi:hypothetical protein